MTLIVTHALPSVSMPGRSHQRETKLPVEGIVRRQTQRHVNQRIYP
jgi:hypothetical protein